MSIPLSLIIEKIRDEDVPECVEKVQENPFAISDAEKQKRILHAFKASLKTEQGGRNSPRILKVSLEPFRAEYSSSLWLAKVTIRTGADEREERWLIRGVQLGLNPVPQTSERLAAHWTGTLHQLLLRGPWLSTYTWKSKADVSKGENRTTNVLFPEIRPGGLIIDVQRLIPFTTPFSRYLKGIGGRRTVAKEDLRILDLISAGLQKLHADRVVPVTLPHTTYISLDELPAQMIKDEYNDALVEWRKRFYHYLRPRSKKKEAHPVLTKRLRSTLVSLIDEYVDSFDDRGDRLVIVHSDPWSPNILLERERGRYVRAIFVDSHRVSYFDRGFDFGRCLFDFGERYLKTGNPIFRALGEHLLLIHKARVGDHELRRTVFFGILSRLFHKIHPESGREFSPEHAKRLCNFYIPMAKNGECRLFEL